MLFIGITGGVGAGKSTVLDYLSSLPDSRIMLADEIAHDLMEPGTACYRRIRSAFPDPLLYLPDGHFNRPAVAGTIFGSRDAMEIFNGIVHPAVKDYVLDVMDREKKSGKCKLLVLEAALLIEEGYDKICDELWYIYTSEENRMTRLMASRGYSEEKCRSIFRSQLPEAVFRSKCTEIIDNNGPARETCRQIQQLLLARGIDCGL